MLLVGYFVIDAAISVFIEECECLSELLNLFFGDVFQEHVII